MIAHQGDAVFKIVLPGAEQEQKNISIEYQFNPLPISAKRLPVGPSE